MGEFNLARLFFERPDEYYRIINRQKKKEEKPEPKVEKKEEKPSQPKLQAWFDLTKIVYIDTETTNGKGSGSLDPFDPESDIALIQTNINGEIKLSRKTPETLAWLKKLDEEGYTFVFHNAFFDLMFFKQKTGMIFRSVYDTMVGSMVLNAGKVKVDKATELSMKLEKKSSEYEEFVDFIAEEDENFIISKEKKSNRFSHSLQATAYRYAHVLIKKDVFNSNWAAELTEDQKRYAEEDVRHLERIMKNQLYFGYKLELQRVLELEMRAVPVTTEMMVHGVLFDREGWLAYANEHKLIADKMEKELDYEIGKILGDMEAEKEYSFFGGVVKPFKVSSQAQLMGFLAKLGFAVEDVSEGTLKELKKEHPIIPKIMKYREHSKIASTYGEKFINLAKQDGRIHGTLAQCETATGRYSSRKPNLQNLIPDMLKSNIRARDGYILMTADYSAVESRILAYAAHDEKFIESVNSKDIHSENARKIFKIPADQPVDPELRRKAKVLSFAVPYGVSAAGLVDQGVASDTKDGQTLLDDFYNSFTGVKKFLDQSVFEAVSRGYTQDAYGRVRWYELPNKEADPKLYSKAKNAAERQAKNHKIQSLSASITKQALVDCYAYLQETGYGYIILTVHDSIFFELKEETAHLAVPALHKIMVDAGVKIFEGIRTPVDYDLGIVYKEKDMYTGEKYKQYTLEYSDGKIIPNPKRISDKTEKLGKMAGVAEKDLQNPEVYIPKLKAFIEAQDVFWLEEWKDWIASFKKYSGV